MLQSINRTLQRLAIFLQVFWVFFPGIFFLLITYFFFNDSLQGKDILITGLHSRQTGLLFIAGLLFWAVVTWYTSRLIAYNNDRLFHVAKEELYQTPRLLGHLCFTTIICALAKIRYGIDNNIVSVIFITGSIFLFVVTHFLFEKIKNKMDLNQLKQYRKIIWVAYIVLIATMTIVNTIEYYILLLPFLQIGFLFTVVTRRKISQTNVSRNRLPDYKHITSARRQYRKFIEWVFYDKTRTNDPLKNDTLVQTEKNIFFLFSLFSFLSLVIYIAAIYSLPIARGITALPIILLSFGILLGAGNIIALFSIKQKINFHFLFLVALTMAGFFREPHFASLRKQEVGNYSIAKRPPLKTNFLNWINKKNNRIRYLILEDKINS